MAPRDLELRAELHYGDENGADSEQSITLENVHHQCPDICRPFTVIVVLEGWARYSSTTTRATSGATSLARWELTPAVSLESRRFYDRQAFAFTFDGTGESIGSLQGTTRVPALQRDRARTNFESPVVDLQRCEEIPSEASDQGGPTAEQSVARFVDGRGPTTCQGEATRTAPQPSQVEISMARADSEGGAERVDSAVPQVSQEASVEDSTNLARWTWDPDVTESGYRARASVINVNRESSEQTNLFISGILAGLAASLFLLGIEKTYKQARVLSGDAAGPEPGPPGTSAPAGGTPRTGKRLGQRRRLRPRNDLDR